MTPLIYATINHINLGQWAQSDSLVGILERFRNRLSDYDRHWLDYLKAQVDADNPEALRAIRRAAELAPGSKAVYNRARAAALVNRPQEAVDALLSLDPERGPMRGWTAYSWVLVWAYSDLGEHEKALAAAQQYRETYGDGRTTLGYEGFALAALGRVEELNALLDDLVALPEQSLSVGTLMSRIAAYLRRHGHTNAAQATIDRAIQWYDARLPETKSGAGWRDGYAWALYVADRWEEAYGVAKPLSEEFPENMHYRGVVGILTACRGDQDEALEISEWLEALDRPYMRGWDTIWRAGIAGALGDAESSVALFRQALREGCPYPEPWLRSWIVWEPFRDYPLFQELMRPKG